MIDVNVQPKADRPNVGLASHNADVCTELFTKYNRKIFNTAYRILGEESSAEDALQETLLNVYRGLASFRGEAKISTWISRITVNVCLGMLRKGKQKQFVDIDEDTALELPAEITVGNDPLLYVSGEEVRAAIEETFRRMSERQGVVVRLHDMEDNTIQEIARRIGCPVGTVKSRLFYGRQEFKEIFNSVTRKGYKRPTIQ